MKQLLRALPRALAAQRRRPPRGQAIILGVVTLLVLALVVFITFNVTVSVQQKIRLQNYADTKAFSTAVAEARALNHFAYTNRAIASAYVGMANVHAYMSEATMLTDAKMAASGIMGQISAMEYSQCFCCCTPFGCGPCCLSHCVHGFEANLNSIGLLIDWFSGKMADRIQNMDDSARNVLNLLDIHRKAIHGGQLLVQVQMLALLGKDELGSLKEHNMHRAASATSTEGGAIKLANLANWQNLFFTDAERKRRIMTEVVNATRHDFAWNRHGSPAIQTVLFPFFQLGQVIRAESLWMGPDGTWIVSQLPDTGFSAGGRTGLTDGDFPNQSGGVAIVSRDANASTTQGKSLNSFDWGNLSGQWRDGVGSLMPLPLLGPVGPAEFMSGDPNRHRVNLGFSFKSPHKGEAHDTPTDTQNFIEFKIDTSYPYNQPSVYAAVSTDGRVNEYGIRGPYEVARDGSGTLRVSGVGPEEGELTLTNNQRIKAFSKAMVYYHRIGDWSDYPNFFNPYWRAKLHPLTAADVVLLGTLDTKAATLLGGAAAIPQGGSQGVNLQ